MLAPRSSGSSSSIAASANGESGWFSAKFGCRSTVSRRSASRAVRDGGTISTTPASRSVRRISSARRASSNCRARGSWLSNTSERMPPATSPPRPITLMSIAAVSFSCGTSGSGSADDESLERALAPGDEPGRRLLAHDLLQLLRVVAGLADGGLVLDLVVGREHHDGAGGVVAGAARRPRPGGTRGR